MSDRESLVNRILPEMQLSAGDSLSATAPPPPIPRDLSAGARAQYRFAVNGNAILTGGSGDLALEGARALLEHGLGGLALLDLNVLKSFAAIEKLKSDFPSANIITKSVDVTVTDEVEEAIKEAADMLKGIDILCCFAGIVGCAHAIDMSPDQWRQNLEVNTTGAFICAQAAAKRMIAQKSGGSIVLISCEDSTIPNTLMSSQLIGSIAISGHRVNFPQPQVAYNVSKAGILHMKSSLAAEWARYGIRVNSISPGYMDTILNEGDGLKAAKQIWYSRNPMGRMGQPQELTGPLVLLCSRAGSYMNGSDIVVDGGGLVF